MHDILEVSTRELFHCRDTTSKPSDIVAAKGGDQTESEEGRISIMEEVGHAIGIPPCVKRVDCSLAKRVKNSDVVCDYTLPETELAIVENVNRHDRSRVNTKFGVVRVLGEGE